MVKALTLKEVNALVQQNHPDVQVVSYTKAREPVTLRCKTHGEVTTPSGVTILQGSGCPKCGRSVAASKARQALSPEAAALGRQRALEAKRLAKLEGRSKPYQRKPLPEDAPLSKKDLLLEQKRQQRLELEQQIAQQLTQALPNT